MTEAGMKECASASDFPRSLRGQRATRDPIRGAGDAGDNAYRPQGENCGYSRRSGYEIAIPLGNYSAPLGKELGPVEDVGGEQSANETHRQK